MMLYTDARGQQHQLTPDHAKLLDWSRLGFTYGDDGMVDTDVVRLLQNRGLIGVLWNVIGAPWRVDMPTPLGRRVLEKWRMLTSHGPRQADVEELPEIGPDTAVAPHELITGRVVRRRTANVRAGRVRAWLPCHDNQSVTVAAGVTRTLVRCRSCSRTFLLDLVDEGDGGWEAMWVVPPHADAINSTTRFGRQP
jgi:hypothetical protein